MRFLSILIASLLIIGSVPAFADQDSYDSQSVEVFGRFRGADGTTPPTRIIRVRYGFRDAGEADDDSGLSSGDVVMWDTTSADGITISGCQAITDTGKYAGVLVTSIGTADTTAFKSNGKNWGWMAIQGYCLAKMDTTGTAGQILGVGEGAGFDAGEVSTDVSRDIGTLLLGTTGGQLGPVWLR